MVKIKLSPFGKKNAICYRVVVMEENSKITGAAIAVLGNYYPRHDKIDVDRRMLDSWLKKGAQPTAKVRQLLNL